MKLAKIVSFDFRREVPGAASRLRGGVHSMARVVRALSPEDGGDMDMDGVRADLEVLLGAMETLKAIVANDLANWLEFGTVDLRENQSLRFAILNILRAEGKVELDGGEPRTLDFAKEVAA